MLTIKIKKIIKLLISVLLFIIFANVICHLITFFTGHDHVYGILPKFVIYDENNIATYFSSICLSFAALLLLTIGVHNKKTGAGFYKQWITLAIIFLYISLDEAISIHELTAAPLRAIFNAHGVFYFAWIIIAIPLLIILAFVFFRFLIHLPKKTRFIFIISATFYIGGALGIELISGWMFDLYKEKSWLYLITEEIEEIFEMAGIIIFIYGLLDYMRSNFKEINLKLE